MWLVGLIAGLLLGALGGGFNAALLGAVVGALIGAWVGRGRTESGVAERVRRIEDRMQLLEAELEMLRQPARIAPQGGEVEATPPASIGDVPAVAEVAAPLHIEAPVVATPPERPTALDAETIPQTPDWPPPWWNKLMAGNPLAKVGVVLLFFGVASALKLAAEYGVMPVSLRLILTAAAGMGLVVFGIVQVRKGERRTFGLAIQGGGFALMYLVAYFMLARYDMIGQGPAFVAFAALGVSCVLLAARQDGPALAVLGLSGAFLAPVMAGGHAETPLPLFTYFALLNVFILTVDWFRAWRVLNIAGFVFTLAIGMVWAIGNYRPEHYLVTQGFLAGFLIVYSAMPVVTSLLRAPGADAWREGILLFGTPLIGTALQHMLVEDVPYALAWSALIASLWYFGLWFLLFRRAATEARLVERANLGLAIAFLTVSVPLAFGAQVTSAFWAAEGTAVLWFGVRRERSLAQATGLLMQLAAGVALLLGWQQLGHRLPVANDAVFGAAIVAFAGLVSARLLRSLDDGVQVPPLLPFAWAMLWWLGTGLGEVDRFAARDMQPPLALLFVAGTTLGLEALVTLWRWPQLRAAAALLPAALWLAALLSVDRLGHPLGGLMALAAPVAFVIHLWLLARHESAGEAPLATPRHLGGWWLLLLALPMELVWQVQRLAPGNTLWPHAIWLLWFAAALGVTVLGVRRQLWPFAAAAGRHADIGLIPPVAGLVLAIVTANLQLSGGGSGLPWLPLVNVLDLALLCGLAALAALRALQPAYRAQIVALVAVLAFVTVSAEAARIAHHWGGVPWTIGHLVDSRLFQALLTLIWTTLAIGVMIAAARGARRQPWFVGFGLLAVVGAKLLLVDAAGRGTLMWTATLLGVAVLVLAASYFAPLPPKEATPAAGEAV